MIERRHVLTAAAACLGAAESSASAPVPPVEFDVFRDGTRIGFHRVSFQRSGGVLTATIAVEIVVRFGGIALFRYQHNVHEVWRDGRFESLSSQTNDDGKPFRVIAVRGVANVAIQSGGGQNAVLPPETIPLTHWNIQCMRWPLFNPQDGAAIDCTVASLGTETIKLRDGAGLTARHYVLSGKIALDDWYDRSDVWAASSSKAKDGSIIEYRRL